MRFTPPLFIDNLLLINILQKKISPPVENGRGYVFMPWPGYVQLTLFYVD